ncbi:MAG: hydrogenase formation protein HypD, partial [Candidatus Bipolaricaulaceae bacterium]
MSGLFSFRDPALAERFRHLLRKLQPRAPVKIVHVCGTHEITIAQHGLRELLPERV